jgi:predicted metal-dependent peptidase
MEQDEKMKELAKKILILARNNLIVNLRFMDSAINRLRLVSEDIETIATNGETIIYNPVHILKLYKTEQGLPARTYLHLLFHCIYQHFFIDKTINRECWDLACDIAVENCIQDLDIPNVNTKDTYAQQMVLNHLKEKLDFLTAEKIYRYYLEHHSDDDKLKKIRKLFQRDDHTIWYLREKSLTLQKVISGASQDEVLLIWKEVSESMQMELLLFSKNRGDKAGSLLQNLREVNRERYDYTEFLKKFAVMGEVMKINDDDFDYIFYTYGLAQYKKMPLIEPLEYKEQKRIKEFVIAIDASGSVIGEEVQAFVQKTYNILKSTESFFEKINLHIIQCDAVIQEAVKITNQSEFDAYIEEMKIRGLGGTDFRPVFKYVDELILRKEFTNLKGMIYFTDGYGIFPEYKPSYETAFVFVNEEYENPEVPPWAIKLVLRKDEI